MALAEEIIPDGEARAIANLVDRLQSKVARDNACGPLRRCAHPKMHGLVRAEFTVAADLPDALRVGLFATPRTYPAWVRFSNQDAHIKPDGARDIRGMAIKLMGVDGTKLLDEELQASTHDFVLISTPAFVTRDAMEFDALLRGMRGGLLAMLGFFVSHPRVGWNLMKAMRRHANPLQVRYFSTTPYALGTAAVKYAATPRVAQPEAVPAGADADYLRLAMVQQLARGLAHFDFAVQLQTDDATMPIEDPGRSWPESQSPFCTVASLVIPPQDFDNARQRAYGEALSFTPWHALPTHRPLGGINRARKLVYQAISRLRHSANQQPRREPAGWEI